MSTDKWKAILVVRDFLERDLPSLYCVAVLAVGSELAAMNIGVAVRAVDAYVLEDQAGVALGAGHFLMHAAQRVSRLIVIELGI
jgi:hypothetical protein